MQKTNHLMQKRILKLPKQEFNASYRRVYKIQGTLRFAYQDAVIYPIRPFYPVRLPFNSLLDELMYPDQSDETSLED